MAEEKKEGGGSPMTDAFFVIGLMLILVWIWYMTGGPAKTDLKNWFIAPPAPGAITPYTE